VYDCYLQMLLRDGMIDPVEHTGLMEIKKSTNLQPAPNDLSRWIAEGQWAALDALCTHVPVFASLSKEMDKNSDDWEKYCSHERPEDAKMPGEWGKVCYSTRLF
jgi:dynein heavy chain, axonemal